MAGGNYAGEGIDMLKGVFIPDMKLPVSCIRCQYICNLISIHDDPGRSRHPLCPLVSVAAILDIDGDQLLTVEKGNNQNYACFSLLPVDDKAEG